MKRREYRVANSVLVVLGVPFGGTLIFIVYVFARDWSNGNLDLDLFTWIGLISVVGLIAYCLIYFFTNKITFDGKELEEYTPFRTKRVKLSEVDAIGFYSGGISVSSLSDTVWIKMGMNDWDELTREVVRRTSEQQVSFSGNPYIENYVVGPEQD